MRLLLVVLLALSHLAGCGDEPVSPGAAMSTTASVGGGGAGGAGGAGCPPGELVADDGACRAAGLPPDWSEPPGDSLPAEDDVGVLPSSCADGFVAQDHGCEPVLPAAPCPPGELALAGERSCRPVMDCGVGTWGAIPVAATTQFVDAAFVGSSDGTAAQPWTSIQQGVDAAAAGAIVAVAAGTYVGDVIVSGKPVALWGRCPALVAVVGTGGAAALFVDAAPGFEVHGLAFEGPVRGVELDASPGAVLDRLWVHDTGFTGIRIVGTPGEPTEITGSLVEKSVGVGIGVIGATASLDRVVVRDVSADAAHIAGNGLIVRDQGGLAPDVSVARSIVERCVEAAVAIEGAQVSIDATLVRDTKPRPVDGEAGWGLGARDGDSGPSHVTVTRSVIANNVAYGLRVYGSDLEVDSTVVRATAPSVSTLGDGVGIEVDRNWEADVPASGVVRHTLVQDSHQGGIIAASAPVLVEWSRVRDTKPQPADQAFGEGVCAILIPDTGARAALTLRDSIVEQSHNAGIYVELSDAVVDRTIVRDTKPNEAVPDLGYGVFVDSSDVVRSSLEMRDSLVERSAGGGILLRGADVGLDRVRVDGVVPGDPNGGGEGIDARADSTETQVTELALTRSSIEHVHSIGLFLAGVHATIEATKISDVRLIPGDSFGSVGVVVAPPPSQLPTSASLRWSIVERVDQVSLAVLGATVSLSGVAVSAVEPTAGHYGHCIEVSVSDALDGDLTVVGSRVEDCGGAGVLVGSSRTSLEGTLVRRVFGRPDGSRGRGIDFQDGARGTVSSCAIEDTHDAGLIVLDSDVGVFATSILRTLPDATGAYGDGIAGVRSDLHVEASRIERSGRAGLAAFGGRIELVADLFECNPIPLDSEPSTKVGIADLVDGGGNVCGCDGATEPCKVLSASLAPPEPLEPVEAK